MKQKEKEIKTFLEGLPYEDAKAYGAEILKMLTPEDRVSFRSKINGMISKRPAPTPEQQAKMQAGRKKKIIEVQNDRSQD